VCEERVSVAVIGAGVAGLGAGARLTRSGRRDFVILERAERIGGTWRDNVYPGVACDIPSQLYSYSFRPKSDWSRVFAPGEEIQDYLVETAHEEGLSPRLRLGQALTGARWDAASGAWRLTSTGGPLTARVLVLAAGRLSEPKMPDVPGLGSFPGRSFHSARWDAAQPLAGLRVGVVGTGASAVQLVPQIMDEAAHVTIFQRTAPWVLPRGDRAYLPGEPQPRRADLSADAEALFAARIAGSPAAEELRRRADGHLAASVSDAKLRAALTPDYEIGCKRALFSDDWYPALHRPDVTLELSALESVEGSVAIAASGARHELDVLVFATGFETTHPPYAELVTGLDGTLAEHWAGGMRSHASTVVAGFPNLFVLDGPNASLGHNSTIEVIEAQLDYLIGAMNHLDQLNPQATLQVSPEAEDAYTRLIDALAARTVWTQGGCDSWYLDEGSRRLTLLWPGTAAEFRDRNAIFDPEPFLAPAGTAAAGAGTQAHPMLSRVAGSSAGGMARRPACGSFSGAGAGSAPAERAQRG
jgi:cation diffusion facilitator CzcD-associated flavoprotein CzcO